VAGDAFAGAVLGAAFTLAVLAAFGSVALGRDAALGAGAFGGAVLGAVAFVVEDAFAPGACVLAAAPFLAAGWAAAGFADRAVAFAELALAAALGAAGGAASFADVLVDVRGGFFTATVKFLPAPVALALPTFG
jgi:hypothetical protein